MGIDKRTLMNRLPARVAMSACAIRVDASTTKHRELKNNYSI
jgi:hypothetical protein